MVSKTVKTFKYRRRDWHWLYPMRNDTHQEIYRRETWWLFWIIPIYSCDELVGNSL